MIRILHYGLSSNLGGIETYLYKLYKNIDRSLFHFDFLIIGNLKPCYYDEFIDMGSKFYFVTNRKKNIIKNRIELNKLFLNVTFDIVHFHLNSLSYVLPVYIALKYKYPVIIHSRNAGIIKSKVSNILHTLNKLRLPKDKVNMIAVSKLAGEWMFGIDENFTVINNGINIDKYQFNEVYRKKIRNEFSLNDNVRLILHLGAFREQKNHLFLLDVFSKFLLLEPNSILVLVGDGNLKGQIEKKIYELNIRDSVILTGNRYDIPEILSASDFFLFPSLFEGFPNSVLEAQTSGLPCLISDRITKEVKISDDCMMMSIDEKDKSWALKIKELLILKDRQNFANIIKSKGLSVENEIKKVQEKYKCILNIHCN